MTDQHRATPKQWQQVEDWVRRELRPLADRIAALEAAATCPHVVTSDEGTSYCGLAEQTANSSAGLTGSNHPAKPDSSAFVVNRRYLQQPSANHIAECGGPCEQGFWNCDCGLLYELNPDLRPQAPAPADGLMQSVGAAICTIADCGDTPLNWAPEARAAILAVAGWLEHRKPAALHCAALLREEVQHHVA